jgi:hypothetical protein
MNLSGRINIIGLGSLMSQKSASLTCPSVENFQLVTVKGHKRVFNKTNSPAILKGRAPRDDKKYACLSVVPDHMSKDMIVSCFSIDQKDWKSFVDREFEYDLRTLDFIHPQTNREESAVACFGDFKSDMDCEELCRQDSDPVRYQKWSDFKEKYNGPMWREDLLPEDSYLSDCLRVTQKLGDDIYNNFIDTTYLGDGRTTIRDYMDNDGWKPCDESLFD